MCRTHLFGRSSSEPNTALSFNHQQRRSSTRAKLNNKPYRRGDISSKSLYLVYISYAEFFLWGRVANKLVFPFDVNRYVQKNPFFWVVVSSHSKKHIMWNYVHLLQILRWEINYLKPPSFDNDAINAHRFHWVFPHMPLLRDIFGTHSSTWQAWQPTTARDLGGFLYRCCMISLANSKMAGWLSISRSVCFV